MRGREKLGGSGKQSTQARPLTQVDGRAGRAPTRAKNTWINGPPHSFLPRTIGIFLRAHPPQLCV